MGWLSRSKYISSYFFFSTQVTVSVGTIKTRMEVVKMENKKEKKLLTVKDLCTYLSIGETKARELLHNPDNGFTIRIGNRLYAHRDKVDAWLLRNIF